MLLSGAVLRAGARLPRQAGLHAAMRTVWAGGPLRPLPEAHDPIAGAAPHRRLRQGN